MTRITGRVRLVALWLTIVFALGASASLAAETRLVDVTAEQARDLIRQRGEQKDFVVLDVRTPQEFAEGHLPGAVNANVLAPDFASRLGAMDRAKTYLVYCRSGNRSTQAVQVMQRLGFLQVYHMSRGIFEWQAKGFPLART